MYHTTVSIIPPSHHQGALLSQLCSLSIESTPPKKTRQFTYMPYLLESVIRNIACFIWLWCNNTNSQLEWKLCHINVKNLVNFLKLICGPYSLLGSKLLMWQGKYIRLSSPSWLMTIRRSQLVVCWMATGQTWKPIQNGYSHNPVKISQIHAGTDSVNEFALLNINRKVEWLITHTLGLFPDHMMPHVVWFLMKDAGLLSEFLCWMWGWVGSKVGMIREANAAGLGRDSLILIEEMEIKTKPFILAQQIWLIILLFMIIPICLLTLMMVIVTLKSWMFLFISILDKLCGGIQFCCVYMLLPVCSPTPEPDLQRKMTFWWSNCPGRGFASTKNQRGQSFQAYIGDKDEEENGGNATILQTHIYIFFKNGTWNKLPR